jgi:hypothetical protein
MGWLGTHMCQWSDTGLHAALHSGWVALVGGSICIQHTMTWAGPGPGLVDQRWARVTGNPCPGVSHPTPVHAHLRWCEAIHAGTAAAKCHPLARGG